MHSTLKVLSRVAGMSLVLSACSLLQQPAAPQTGVRPARPVQAQPQPDSKQDLLFREASRLAGKVKSGELSRVAAADQLNVYRLRLIGANLVDDNSFAMYRYLAVERDAGRLTQEESQARMEMRLREWLRRWPKLQPKPPAPVFTNFLLKLYGLPALG
ncbi:MULTISPECIES: hypothetical protein [Aquitalea]|uniref:Lipoprotein n=1 Tax=Aquitalea magnusonii TaxID=332411 RepID=A0A318J6P9_9NEIS|nr:MULTISPECIES: hypothetical protein [Aquitalea]PXX44655.1 hypothetical protein DFR38_11277 [Aquitalea magnusonii]